MNSITRRDEFHQEIDYKNKFLKCPIENCDQKLELSEFKNGQGIRHMNMSHKIRYSEMMKLNLKWKIVTQNESDQITWEKILKFKEKLRQMKNKENTMEQVLFLFSS